MTGLDIDMYERFIDDTDILSGVIQPGWRYCNQSENVVFKKEWMEEDEILEEDKRTALVMRDVANTVHPMIQMEIDFPSNHSDGKLPILDLKCWIGSDDQLWFQHYEKPMASRVVLPAMSALPMKQKRNIHVNECIRRLRNL